jgi:hypothetical protein
MRVAAQQELQTELILNSLENALEWRRHSCLHAFLGLQESERRYIAKPAQAKCLRYFPHSARRR